jgi:hypothetical protein
MSELAVLVGQVEQARAQFLSGIAGTSPIQSMFRVQPDAWSIAEITSWRSTSTDIGDRLRRSCVIRRSPPRIQRQYHDN